MQHAPNRNGFRTSLNPLRISSGVDGATCISQRVKCGSDIFVEGQCVFDGEEVGER